VRVDEAWRMGLDAISITDHIEYQPHRDDVPTHHNRPYELAQGRARQANVLLVRGAEITRDTPPGHFNAIFLEDVGPLDTSDFVEAVKQANEQGAFVFWNHQEWKGAERGSWGDVHTQLLNNKWFHGMEICNGETYYPTAHRWCLDKGLTMLATSDIHGADVIEKNTAARHRTLTLVFAKERTPESIKEALLEGRTVAWFEDKLIGRRDLLEPFFSQCVRIEPPHLRAGNTIWVAVKNLGAADVRLKRAGSLGPRELVLAGETTTLVKISGVDPSKPLELPYTATNFWIEPETGMPVKLTIAGE
jgi:hypothetical protein